MDSLNNHLKFERLTQKLGYQFVRFDLLVQAFMHSSYVNEQAMPQLQDNERLEFLGDAVLDLATSHILMEYFQEAREGDLSKFRAMLVDEAGLFQVAKDLELGDYLFLGRGEEQCRGREKPSILANTMEALLGALYLDAGFETALQVIRSLFSPFMAKIATRGEIPYDFKSQLQEYTKKEYKELPTYRLCDESGPAHDKTFRVELSLNGRVLAVEEGKSKKEAEQKSAREAFYCLTGSRTH